MVRTLAAVFDDTENVSDRMLYTPAVASRLTQVICTRPGCEA